MGGPIVVTGGTGALGRVVVARLLTAGHEVRVVSRRHAPADDLPNRHWATADLLTGEGATDALAGAGVVVHCATSINGGREVTATRSVVQAARAAGSPHIVYISIVGVDRVPFGYYRGKLAAEGLIAGSDLPYTILRERLGRPQTRPDRPLHRGWPTWSRRSGWQPSTTCWWRCGAEGIPSPGCPPATTGWCSTCPGCPRSGSTRPGAWRGCRAARPGRRSTGKPTCTGWPPREG